MAQLVLATRQDARMLRPDRRGRTVRADRSRQCAKASSMRCASKAIADDERLAVEASELTRSELLTCTERTSSRTSDLIRSTNSSCARCSCPILSRNPSMTSTCRNRASQSVGTYDAPASEIARRWQAARAAQSGMAAPHASRRKPSGWPSAAHQLPSRAAAPLPHEAAVCARHTC